MNNIKLIKEKFVAKIILSRPPLNILGIDDLNELTNILKEIKKEPDLKIVTIESDQKLFSAGVDIKDHSKAKITELLNVFHQVFYELLEIDIPVLALVKSGCLGGGAELAMFCDFIIASDKAYFSNPEIKLGCFPPVSMAILPYITGSKKALEIILTGEKLTAEEALNFGIVNKVVPDEQFETETEQFISYITYNSASVIKSALNSFKNLNYSGLKEKLEKAEMLYLEELMKLEDTEEGIKSFLEKRPPVWKNK